MTCCFCSWRRKKKIILNLYLQNGEVDLPKNHDENPKLHSDNLSTPVHGIHISISVFFLRFMNAILMTLYWIPFFIYFIFFELIQPQITQPINQSGTKYIDPDSGLIYFKYDFGYEFGIIFPGEGRKFIAGGNKFSNNSNRSAQLSCHNEFIHNSADAINIPVTHEKSIKSTRGNSNDFLQLHKKTAPAGSRLYKPQPRPAIAFNVDEFHTNGPIQCRASVDRGTI